MDSYDTYRKYQTPGVDYTQRPVFVYGTLRYGQGNYSHLIRGNYDEDKTRLDAVLPNHSMFTNNGGPGIPFVVDNDDIKDAACIGERVMGDLFWIQEDAWRSTLSGLDSLEGYSGPNSSYNMYTRGVVDVVTQDGETVEAYVYLIGDARDARIIKPGNLISHGDWLIAANRTRQPFRA